MNRVLGAIVYNWPLKLAALALATLLYVGLIFSENATSKDVSVKIQLPTDLPLGTLVIGDPGEVTSVRMFIADPTNVVITSANFSATLDVSQIQPGPQAQSVRVIVTSADPRVQVLSAVPQFVSVRLEKVSTAKVPVDVVPGTLPDGFSIDKPKPAFSQAEVRGAQSDIDRVVLVRTIIPVDTSGLDVDSDFPLTPVDQLGEKVNGVEVEPATVHVTMAVYHDRRTASVPVVATVVGTPAEGFEVQKISLSDDVVSIQGDPENLANAPNARTLPVSLDGHSSDFDMTVGFDLPSGVTALTPESVTVHVALQAVTGSRNFQAGIALNGDRPDRAYSLSLPAATVTIGGSPQDLDRLNGAALTLLADVADLEPGVHVVTLRMTLQSGLTVVAISPATVTVTVTAAGASGAPGPSASGGG